MHGWACLPQVDKPVTIRIVDDSYKKSLGEVIGQMERVDLATLGLLVWFGGLQKSASTTVT